MDELFEDLLHFQLPLECGLQPQRECALREVLRDGMALARFSEDFGEDHEIVLAAVSEDGLALQFTSLQHDLQIVLAAVRQNGMALKFADPTLQADHALILVAIESNPKAIQFAIDVPLFKVRRWGNCEEVSENRRGRSVVVTINKQIYKVAWQDKPTTDIVLEDESRSERLKGRRQVKIARRQQRGRHC